MCARSLSCWTLVTSWTVACQAPLSMGFFRQEYIGVACHFLLQGLWFLACKIIVNNAIDLFDKEHWKKVHCSPGSISCFFRSCGSLGVLKQCTKIHSLASSISQCLLAHDMKYREEGLDHPCKSEWERAFKNDYQSNFPHSLPISYLLPLS